MHTDFHEGALGEGSGILRRSVVRFDRRRMLFREGGVAEEHLWMVLNEPISTHRHDSAHFFA